MSQTFNSSSYIIVTIIIILCMITSTTTTVNKYDSLLSTLPTSYPLLPLYSSKFCPAILLKVTALLSQDHLFNSTFVTPLWHQHSQAASLECSPSSQPACHVSPKRKLKVWDRWQGTTKWVHVLTSCHQFLARPSKVTFGFKFPPLGRGRLKCSPERAQIKARALSQRGRKRIGATLQYFPVRETFQIKGVPLIGAGLSCLVVLWWDSLPYLSLGQNPRALNARWEVLIASDEKGL